MAEIVALPITPPAGVVKTNSPRAIEGRWSDTEKVRFVNGKPQKIGGWTKKTATPMSGAPRALHAWRDNNSAEYIGAGTFNKLYVIPRDFSLNDITPIETSGTLNNPFDTTIGSSTVTTHHATHGRNVGDTVHYSGAVAVGGVTPNGEFVVTSAPTVNTYTFVAAQVATSTASGGGGASVAYQYEISIGTQYGAYGLGYGVSRYGLSTWGTARTVTATTVFIEPRIWSLDHFGQILLASYNVGSIYTWDPSAGSALTTRAAIIADAPTDVRAMFVTPERFVIALCEDMKIKWCTEGNYTIWTPAPDNTANIRGVTEGTKLVGGRTLGGGVSLIWSDAALYVHQFTGSDLIFDTRLSGKNCGLVSPSAAITVGSVAYWMGTSNFFLYNGAVQVVPNVEDIRAYLFDQLKTDAGYLCAAMYVPRFNEVWFFVVVQGGTEPSLYAIVNLNDFSWSVGMLNRAGGTYFTHGDTRPYWSDSAGYLYLQEDGHDADGAAMDAYCTLAPAGLDKGKHILDLEGIEPDFFEQSGDVELTVSTWDRIRKATDTPMDTQTDTVGEDDGLVDLRLAGRYAGMTVRSNTLGGYFRFGAPTVYAKPAGTRR